jgi:hypothetical protein
VLHHEVENKTSIVLNSLLENFYDRDIKDTEKQRIKIIDTLYGKVFFINNYLQVKNNLILRILSFFNFSLFDMHLYYYLKDYKNNTLNNVELNKRKLVEEEWYQWLINKNIESYAPPPITKILKMFKNPRLYYQYLERLLNLLLNFFL